MPIADIWSSGAGQSTQDIPLRCPEQPGPEHQLVLERHARNVLRPHADAPVARASQRPPAIVRSTGIVIISGVRDRLPTLEPLRDQLRASPIVVSVQDAHVLGIGAPVHTTACGSAARAYIPHSRNRRECLFGVSSRPYRSNRHSICSIARGTQRVGPIQAAPGRPQDTC